MDGLSYADLTYDTKNAKQKMVGSIGNSLIICSIEIIANKLHISSGEIFPCTRQFCPTVLYSCMLLLGTCAFRQPAEVNGNSFRQLTHGQPVECSVFSGIE